jgi:hypothetical protein
VDCSARHCTRSPFPPKSSCTKEPYDFDCGNGDGLNDPYRLNATTVHSNAVANTLTGHGGGASDLNLYFATLNDTTDQDLGLGEQLIPIM